MNAAIYARKSTEQNVSDDAKSVTRQLELGRAFAAEKGWTVLEEFQDDGISGVEAVKLVSRARMLAAATDGKFSVLIVRDLDRLSRNDEELPSLIYSLRDCGVEIWTYADRTRVDTRTALNRGMLSMKATFAAAEREAAQTRTAEAMRRKVQRGEVGGGRVLGYRNVGEQGQRRREVDPEQARLVVRVFEMAAEGKGLLRIARTLNGEEVPNPTGQIRTGRTGAKRSEQWSATGIREVLHRSLYRGQVVYGQTRNEYRHGRRIKVAGEAPLALDAPALRIVSEELWQAAHERMAATHAVYLRRTGGKLGGKPASGLESKYLLSGSLRCGECGGGLIISTATSKRGKPQVRYICATHRTRPGACSNKYGVPTVALTDAVLAKLKSAVLNPVMLGDLLMAEWNRQREAPEAVKAERQTVAARIGTLDGELQRLAEAIAAGSVPETIVGAIRAREAERSSLRETLERLEGLTIEAGEDFDVVEWLEQTRALLENLRDTLEVNPVVGRQVLRQLLVEPIRVTPRVEDGVLSFDFAGVASLAKWDLSEGCERHAGPHVHGEMTRHGFTGRLARPRVSARAGLSAVSGVWCPRTRAPGATPSRSGASRGRPSRVGGPITALDGALVLLVEFLCGFLEQVA